jgi:hypothetical protein
MQQIIVLLQTGNNNSATIKQTGMKTCQDGLNYGFGGYKNEAFVNIQ